MAKGKKLISDETLVGAICFFAVTSFFLGKAALNGQAEADPKVPEMDPPETARNPTTRAA